MFDRAFPKFDVPRFASSQDADVALGVLSSEGSLRLVEPREVAGVAYGGRFELKDDPGLEALAEEDPPWPDQFLAGDGMFGGRFELKDDPGLEPLAQDDPPWPDQFLPGDGMFGGRFELKEGPDLEALAQDDPPWPGQLLAGGGALGGRFAPKFIPEARVAVARALTSELPAPRPAAPLIPRPPFEPAV